MYAVIFRAEIRELDEEYQSTAARMRELAMSNYGCLDFISACEGKFEIAISYWPDLEHIHAWKQDPEHVTAQQLGRMNWYRSYRVEVVEIVREYGEEA